MVGGTPLKSTLHLQDMVLQGQQEGSSDPRTALSQAVAWGTCRSLSGSLPALGCRIVERDGAVRLGLFLPLGKSCLQKQRQCSLWI